MKSFVTIVNSIKQFTIITNVSILDVCQGPTYSSGEINTIKTAFFKTGIHSKAEQPLRGIELQEKEAQRRL